MSRSDQFASCLPRPGFTLTLALALFFSAGSCLRLVAQSSDAATLPARTTQSTPAALPATPSPAFAPFNPEGATYARVWTRSTQDPFQPAPSFGNFAGSSGMSMGLNGAARGFGSSRLGTTRFGIGRQGAGGINPFGPPGMGERQGSIAPLFPLSDGTVRGMQSGTFGVVGSAPAAPLSLNQLMRGSFNLPLSSSSSSLRFSYQDVFRPGATFSDLGRPYSSTLFTSPDLGNGVFFSAGTGYGSRSMPGAPAATLGNGLAGAPKHSGTAINLKLSF